MSGRQLSRMPHECTARSERWKKVMAQHHNAAGAHTSLDAALRTVLQAASDAARARGVSPTNEWIEGFALEKVRHALAKRPVEVGPVILRHEVGRRCLMWNRAFV